MNVNGYEIKVVCANQDKKFGTYGDIYLDYQECKKDHPDDDVIFGFYVEPPSNEYMPDWFDTLEEALEACKPRTDREN